MEKLGLKVSRLYDVAPQKAGHPYVASDPKNYRFVYDVWQATSAYMRATGIHATMSFCRADPKGVEYTFRIFDTLGYPSIISIDIYNNLYANLVNLANAMDNHRKTGSPVFIQETFFNDSQSASDIRKAMADKKLNIRYVMQWPLTRAGWAAGPVGRVTDVVNLSSYDSFLRYSNNSPYFYPVITGAGLGCAFRQCIWLTGAFSISGCQVALYAGDWRNGSKAEVVLDAAKREAFCKPNVVTFVIPPDLRAKFPSLNVVVLNASNSLRTTWSTPRNVPIR